MDERVARLEAIVADLTGRVADLETRIARAEPSPSAPGSAALHDPISSAISIGPGSIQQWLALLGRTLVVLGGAYLLRAITESHVVSPQTGVLLGLLYGAPWLVLASRAEGRGAHLDALCHALATALIGYPLVWEATVRFQVLTPAQSAGLLSALTGAALVLSSRRQLQSLAWVVTFGALGSALGLAAATASWVPYTAVAVGVGIATLWLAYRHHWNEMRWPAAFVANLMMFVTTGRAGAHGGAGAVIWLQVVTLTAYLGSFAVRLVFDSNRLVVFEVAQSAAVLAVAFGGLVYLLAASSVALQILGVVCILAAGAAYATAFGFTEKHRSPSVFVFQTMIAFFFGAAGIAVALPQPVAAALYVSVAVGALAAALTRHRMTIAMHAILFAIAGCMAAGLLGYSTTAFVVPTSDGVLLPSLASVAALGALLAILAFPLRDARERWPYVAPASRCVVASLAVWGAAAVLVAVVLAILPAAVDGSQLSTIRTIVLVVAASAAALAGLHRFGREVSWLVYPLLLAAGLKLVFVDFVRGRPTTLFAALGAYGAALILAPRILRRAAARQEETAAEAPELEVMARGAQAASVISTHPQTTVR